MWWKIRLALFVALTLGACDCGSDPRATGDAGGPGEDAATEDASTEPDASEPEAPPAEPQPAGAEAAPVKTSTSGAPDADDAPGE